MRESLEAKLNFMGCTKSNDKHERTQHLTCSICDLIGVLWLWTDSGERLGVGQDANMPSP